MIIYDNNDKAILDIPVDDSSYRYRAIRQGDRVFLHFSLTGHVEIPLYSHIEYQGQRYILWKPENLRKNHSRDIGYSVEFGGWWGLLERTRYKLLSGKPHKLKFSLTATPRTFMGLLVDNLNLHDSGWTLGTCVEAAEKPLSFSHESCMAALNRLADECGTEWEITGKRVSLGKVERFKDSPVPLGYGRGKGFKSGVGRTGQGDKAPVTVLYVQGGDRNIDRLGYGSDTLLLPKSQEIEYQGRRYGTDADGMYVTRADKEVSIFNEDGYDASNIYPSRVGEVTKVETEPGKDTEGNPVTFYNIVDATIPDSLNYRDCRLDGNKVTVIFQSGKLAGREFDIVQTDKDLTGYDHGARTFKLVSTQEDGMTLPNDRLCPSIGDKYAVFNISLPAAYVCDNATRTGASWDMFREAARYMYENEDERFTFTGDLDGIWAKGRWLEIGGKLVPGGHVEFSDGQFQPEGILIRITGVKDYVNKPHSPELELSNVPVSGLVSSELGKIDANEVTDGDNHKRSLQFTKRSFRAARETMGMLADALLANFTGSITPVAVATMQMLVGDESLQFRFVNGRTNPVAVDDGIRYDKGRDALSIPAGTIQHMTLGIKDISPRHEYRFWDMGSYESPYLDPGKKYYLYARCGESGQSGTFLMSEVAIRMGQESGYHHLLVGVLNSAYGGEREDLARLYGFTEILPGRITTDRIVSTDGATYFDLSRGEIGGRIAFASGSSGLGNVKEWAKAQEAIEAAQSTADDAAREIAETGEALSAFETTVTGSFKDGVIEEAEARAIEKYVNTLETEKADADAVYDKLYVNAYLDGVAKAGLLNAKITYNGSHSNLIGSVRAAIADKQTTEAEKADVDRKFASYRAALSDYKAGVEVANKAIQDRLRSYSDTAAGDSGREAKESLAKGLGYDSYAAMEAAAKEKNTIIDGGKINTSLIEAKDILTSSLLAELVKTTKLVARDMDVDGGSIGGFEIASGRIGSAATVGGDGGGLSIYKNFIRVGGGDSYVMIGDDVIPGSLGGAFTASARVVNNQPNTSGAYGYDTPNYGLMVDVSGGTKNYGLRSNAALLAPAHINSRIGYVTFGSGSYTIDFSQNTIFMVKATAPSRVSLPSEAEVARMFSMGSLPDDFGFEFTFCADIGTQGIAISMYHADGELGDIEMQQGDSMRVLGYKRSGTFRYQILGYEH